MEQFKVPETEIRNRIDRIQKKLQVNNIEAMLVVQRVDLYYFTGTAQNGFLYIPAHGQPLLLIKKYMPRALKETSIDNGKIGKNIINRLRIYIEIIEQYYIQLLINI